MRFFLYATMLFSAMNFYIFWRMRAAFGSGKWQWVMLCFVVGIVTLFTQRRSFTDTVWADAAHTVVHVWVGIVLIAVTWLLFLDGARILAWIIDHVAGSRLGHMLRLERSVPVVLALCLVLSTYAAFEAITIRTKHVVLPTAKLPEGVQRLRLVAMSDVHIGASTGLWRLERMVNAVRRVEPDMLLMLGDLVDTDMRGKTREAALFASITAPRGKFAVLGNHEAYRGLDNSLRFTRAAGFEVLRSRAVDAGGIIVAGVDDPMFFAPRDGGAGAAEESACRELLRSLDHEQFILLLRHRPGTHASIAGLFDLQLSGHTHGGQIWPGHILAKRANGFAAGLTAVSGIHGESALYVSRGTGMWGPPMRLFAPPEVTVVDLIPCKDNELQ